MSAVGSSADNALAESFELPVGELCDLMDVVERDLVNFLAMAADWGSRYLPDQSAPVTAVLARVLDLSGPDGDTPTGCRIGTTARGVSTDARRALRTRWPR